MKRYSEIEPSTLQGVSTGIKKLDMFLSSDGGIPMGYVMFLTGTSGAGKTTLCKLIQKNITSYKTAMLQREVSAELLAKQLKNIDTSSNENCYIEDKMNIQEFLEYTSINNHKLIIIDSLQRCQSDFPDLGEKAAAKKIYELLRAWSEINHSTVILIGQVNKDGSFEGSNAIKHDADFHGELIYDKKKNTRSIQSTKNRMGGTVGAPLFYKFVDTGEVISFESDKTTSFNDSLLESCISYLKQFEDSKDENVIAFLNDCDTNIKSILKDSDGYDSLEIVNAIRVCTEKYSIA